MKLIYCKNCKRFLTIEAPGVGMCICGHSFFKVDSFKAGIDKKTGKKTLSVKCVMVWGECTVWYLSDKKLKESKEGDIVEMQYMREPHENIKRVSKGTILFQDRGGKENAD